MDISHDRVEKMAKRYGVRAKDNQGHVNLNLIAAELGVPIETLYAYCKRNGIKRQGRTRFYLVTLEDFERLKVVYSKPAEPVLSTKQAAEVLSYCPAYVRMLAARGALRSVRIGASALGFPVAEVERFKRERAHA